MANAASTGAAAGLAIRLTVLAGTSAAVVHGQTDAVPIFVTLCAFDGDAGALNRIGRLLAAFTALVTIHQRTAFATARANRGTERVTTAINEFVIGSTVERFADTILNRCTGDARIIQADIGNAGIAFAVKDLTVLAAAFTGSLADGHIAGACHGVIGISRIFFIVRPASSWRAGGIGIRHAFFAVLADMGTFGTGFNITVAGISFEEFICLAGNGFTAGIGWVAAEAFRAGNDETFTFGGADGFCDIITGRELAVTNTVV